MSKMLLDDINTGEQSSANNNNDNAVNNREGPSQHMETDEEMLTHCSENARNSAAQYETSSDNTEEGIVSESIEEHSATLNEPPQYKTGGNEPPIVSIQPDADAGSSHSSNSQGEKCPICLVCFSTQEVGSPETCDHYFCSLCIQRWVKKANTCPVDRKPFTSILVRKHINGRVIKEIPVTSQEESHTEESDVEMEFEFEVEEGETPDQVFHRVTRSLASDINHYRPQPQDHDVVFFNDLS